MDKVDFKRSLPGFRAKQGRFDLIEVPDSQYLMIDGHGDPNTSPDFASALTSLYPLAYGLKFFSKLELGRDYVVPPLEGLWWADDMTTFTSARDKSAWDFTLMLFVPDWLDGEHVDGVVETVRSKGSAPRLGEIRFETLRERKCVQTLHIGSFDDEGAGPRAHAHRGHSRGGDEDVGRSSRDLSQRLSPHRAGEAAHDPPSAGDPTE